MAGLSASDLARAGDPVADTWYETDHDFSGDDCTPASSTICTLSGGGATMTCLAENAADTTATRLGAKAYMIRNETDDDSTDICGGYDYCLFGALRTNFGTSEEEYFYCQFDGRDIDTILLWGTDEADELRFHHEQNGEFDLEGHSGVALVTGIMKGKDGDDQILHGSRSEDSGYRDVIHGDDGADRIDTHAGNDIVHDGAGDDVIVTGPGDDTVYLSSGTNQVSTEDGADTVYGGSDADHVHLGDGEDIAQLGPGQDVACGGDDDDELDGQFHDDKLWGGNGSGDILDGGFEATADSCSAVDSSGSNTECEALLTVAPSECPVEHPTSSD